MAIDFMEYLKETFDNPEDLDLEKIQSIALQTSAYLESLGEVIQEGDEKAKQQAIEAALEMKEFLEQKVQNVVQQAGVTQEELLALADSPEFNNKEQQVITNISDSLSSSNNKKSKITKIKPTPLS